MSCPDIKNFTDDELCVELAALAAGGENVRVPARWLHLVQAEYDKRAGITWPSEADHFNRYRGGLQSQSSV